MIEQFENIDFRIDVGIANMPDFLRALETKELAPSMEVQAEEIRDVFCEIPDLSFDRWKELGVDQRTTILNQFEQKIASIEMRDAFTVNHEPTRAGLMGYYDGKKLVISDNLLRKNDYASYREALDTLFHEGRHAYQFYNLDVKRTEQSDERFKSWEMNIKELKYQNSYVHGGFARYYTQPVEVDARLFAETVIRKLGI